MSHGPESHGPDFRIGPAVSQRRGKLTFSSLLQNHHAIAGLHGQIQSPVIVEVGRRNAKSQVRGVEVVQSREGSVSLSQKNPSPGPINSSGHVEDSVPVEVPSHQAIAAGLKSNDGLK